MAQREKDERRTDKMTSWRASLRSSLALYKRKKGGHQLRLIMRPGAPSRYVFTTAWMGLRWPMPSKCPWAPCSDKKPTEQIQKDPYDSKGYTHTQPRPVGCRDNRDFLPVLQRQAAERHHFSLDVMAFGAGITAAEKALSVKKRPLNASVLSKWQVVQAGIGPAHGK